MLNGTPTGAGIVAAMVAEATLMATTAPVPLPCASFEWVVTYAWPVPGSDMAVVGAPGRLTVVAFVMVKGCAVLPVFPAFPEFPEFPEFPAFPLDWPLEVVRPPPFPQPARQSTMPKARTDVANDLSMECMVVSSLNHGANPMNENTYCA